MTFFLSRLSLPSESFASLGQRLKTGTSVCCLLVGSIFFQLLIPYIIYFQYFFHVAPPQHTYLFTPLQCQEHRAYTQANALSARAISQPLNQPLPCPCTCSGLQKLISLLFDLLFGKFFHSYIYDFSYIFLSCCAYFIVAAL